MSNFTKITDKFREASDIEANTPITIGATKMNERDTMQTYYGASDPIDTKLHQEATNFATMRHIERVRNILNMFIADLLRRGEEHDQSKLESPEVELFTEYTPKLATCTYGSDEYKSYLKAMGPALAHHYAKNSHHPEHWKDGINDMTLLDVLELFADWKSASERHNDGSILKSIEHNADRFGISPQLVRIMENTSKMFD